MTLCTLNSYYKWKDINRASLLKPTYVIVAKVICSDRSIFVTAITVSMGFKYTLFEHSVSNGNLTELFVEGCLCYLLMSNYMKICLPL